MEFTEWFPKGTKPARPGIYHIRLTDDRSEEYAEWNGASWSYFTSSIDDLFLFKYVGSRHIRHNRHSTLFSWRGLAEMPLTDWLDGSKVVPAHVGVYEVNGKKYPGTIFQHWNGKFWGCQAKTVATAEKLAFAKSNHQNNNWRGVAVKP